MIGENINIKLKMDINFLFYFIYNIFFIIIEFIYKKYNFFLIKFLKNKENRLLNYY